MSGSDRREPGDAREVELTAEEMATTWDEDLVAALTDVVENYGTCNGPRDCGGTERGCVHCGPGGHTWSVVEELKRWLSEAGFTIERKADDE